jgi:hypothetical protein
MKVLTLWQPWATLVACGAKTIETRSWPTAYRGPLAIHAGKLRDPQSLGLCLRQPFLSHLIHAGIKHTNELPFGAVVAVAELSDCYRFDPRNIPAQGEDERAFGDFAPGRFGWRLVNVRRLSQPVGCRGQQGLKDLWPDVESLILTALGGFEETEPVADEGTLFQDEFPESRQ